MLGNVPFPDLLFAHRAARPLTQIFFSANRRLIRRNICGQRGGPIHPEASIWHRCHVGVDLGDLRCKRVHADQDVVLVELCYRAAQALDAVGIRVLPEPEVPHTRAPSTRVEHHLAKSCLAAIVDYRIDILLTETQKPIGLPSNRQVVRWHAIAFVTRQIVVCGQAAEDRLQFSSWRCDECGAGTFQLRSWSILRSHTQQRVIASSAARALTPEIDSPQADGVPFVPSRVQTRPAPFGDRHANANQCRVSGSRAGHFGQPKSDPVVSHLDSVRQFGVAISEGNRQSVIGKLHAICVARFPIDTYSAERHLLVRGTVFRRRCLVHQRAPHRVLP